MPLDLPTLIALSTACAPQVAPQTLLAVARVESGFDPLAIGINDGSRRSRRPVDREAAIAEATALIAAGRNVDLGLTQINARNLGWLGLTPRTAFDPCRSLAAGAKVLEFGYRRAAPRPGQEQAGLRTALSYYNTGHPRRGLHNGYAARVVAAAGQLVPGIANAPGRAIPGPEPEPRSWDVFARARGGGGALVFPSPGG